MVVSQVVFLWSFLDFLVDLFQELSKRILMALYANSPSSPPLPSLSRKRRLKEAAAVIMRVEHDDLQALLARESARKNMATFADKEEHVEETAQPGRGAGEGTPARKMRKRPARLVVPESFAASEFREVVVKAKEGAEREMEVEGSGYFMASKKGQRLVMEDGYGVMININGNSNEAFFGVFDGHGGRAAVDLVSEKLGENIIAALSEIEKGEDQVKLAIKAGYMNTDREFLSQGVKSGACAATVLIKDGELHAANVGDCRVIMSMNGIAAALTSDHNAGREDERIRIENLGGYVNYCNGVWRVQDSLAVSRAIGDMNMKEWIISEPETKKIHLTRDCEFLIMASDGLWDKVSNQEAVDVVLKHDKSMKSCKELIDICRSRGSRDDVTVMVVDLQRFLE
ncbi:probable protein phosphatase 2C 74 [Typha angustifolia]|uniref:probable protein phosphatase 2C 74 n=1 Tax=Typha angustifolia TaxID=59011 RepID=UPI003C2D8E38